MIGNTIVLKPASAAETLIDSDVSAVTFTGSVPVGAKVAQRDTSQIKKIVLELGGSDPFIVCEDVDIEKITTGAVKGRFINCGELVLQDDIDSSFAIKTYERYVGKNALNNPQVQFSVSLPRYMVVIKPTKIMSWDFTKAEAS